MYKDKLEKFIRETPKLTKVQIANLLGISPQALHKKFNSNKKSFWMDEALMIRDYLKSRDLDMDKLDLNKMSITRVIDINKKEVSDA